MQDTHLDGVGGLVGAEGVRAVAREKLEHVCYFWKRIKELPLACPPVFLRTVNHTAETSKAVQVKRFLVHLAKREGGLVANAQHTETALDRALDARRT